MTEQDNPDGGADGSPSSRHRPGISRRSFLGAAAAVTGATVVGGFIGQELVRGGPSVAPSPAPGGSGSPVSSGVPSDAAVIPFRGPHQAGIATPAQDRLAIAAFDITTPDRAE